MPAAPTCKQSGDNPVKDAGIMLGILVITISITTSLQYNINVSHWNLLPIHVLSVLIISIAGHGYLNGLIAAGVNALAYEHLIIKPHFGFSFETESLFTLVTLLLVTVVTSTLASRLREHKNLALKQQERLGFLFDISQNLLYANSVAAILSLLAEALETHIGSPVIIYANDPLENADVLVLVHSDGDERYSRFLNPNELQNVHSPFSGDKAVSENEGIFYLPIVSNGSVTLVVGIDCGSRGIAQNDLTFAKALIMQAALALDVQMLSDKQKKLINGAETEKVRSMLLRGISHDFRTPMATIRGACSAMLEQQDLPAETRRTLLTDVMEYSDWLMLMVENILAITKISDEAVHINRKNEVAEEVISSAVSIVRRKYKDRIIQIQIPDELIIVPMDAVLIVQVLVNMLENAIKHSPADAPVLVQLRKQDNAALFEITDHGTGIALHLIADLFNPCATPEKTKPAAVRGSGIGLLICKTIIDAHGGRIEGKNLERGGAVFSFLLPLGGQRDEVQKDNISS